MAVILGIDPGSVNCGYGLINAVGSKLEYISCGTIRLKSLPFHQRLETIHSTVSEIITEYQPEFAAVEEVFVGKSYSSALKLGQARGAALVACTNHNLEIFEYAALKVKQSLTGSGRADKSQMQHMITSILSLSGTPQEDAADALCVAVCHAHIQHTLIKLAGVKSHRRGRMTDYVTGTRNK